MQFALTEHDYFITFKTGFSIYRIFIILPLRFSVYLQPIQFPSGFDSYLEDFDSFSVADTIFLKF
jgi:hypothetical protein